MLRRSLLAVPLWPLAAAAAPADLAFRVLREGREVGTHRVRFREAGGLLEVTSELRIQVRLAGFTVFRLSQDTEERWRGPLLVALTSRSDRNGRAGGCEAREAAGALLLRGAEGETRLPRTACPLTWWRAESLARDLPLFEVREGRPVAPRIERVREGGGLAVRVIGAETNEARYDAAGNWIGFATTGEDGSRAVYERS
jgi:hypothetical protein